MKYDKTIMISCAGNRREVVWRPQRMLWSEFIRKASQPVVSPETFQEYKAMNKGQQDDLKDVGGYVGGTLKDNRRRTGNVINRSLITLDADSIPAGGTDEILKRVSALGCAYVVYSTRKHEGPAPRLRIVIPTDRDMAAEEYEPVARKLADLMGMGIFDPASFRVAQFMYWASRCSDGEWVFLYEDRAFLRVDGILGMYADWRDTAAWPEVPGIRKMIDRSARKQQDPREKDGVIGAFCRVYDVPAAVDAFLADVYEDCGNGRYTYREGSTAAGAVLYDDGRFLYSNHATDPAGGKLCNSYDLVRVHLFGHLDGDAKPDTPTPKLPSAQAMREFAMQDEAVRQEHVRSMFGAGNSERELYPDIQVSKQGKITLLPTASNLKTLLKNSGIHITYDMLLRRVTVESPDPVLDEKFNGSTNGYNNLLVFCADQFVRDGLRVSTSKVHEWITALADENKRNAAREYLEKVGAAYSGTQEINRLFNCIRVQGDADFYKMLLRKWLCQGVAMAHNERGKFGADGVLVLKGPQGIGKTTFFRKCCSIGQNYFIEGASLDGSKDKLMESTRGWIAELGELPRSMKDQEFMKAFITSPSDTFRAPYDKKADTYPRLTSFGATTNSDQFLKEENSRRYWTIEAEGIDLEGLAGINFDAVWAEAMALYRLLGPISFRLTVAERAVLAHENRTFQIVSDEEAPLRDMLDWSQPRAQWRELTASAICNLLGTGGRLSPVKIGRALRKIGYSKDSTEFPIRGREGHPTYLIPCRAVWQSSQTVQE